MKSQKELRKAMKSNEKQQKATKSNKKQQRTSELEKPKRARKNQDKQRKAQKSNTYVAFCRSSLLAVFEIESVLSQKPKQANAFGCSFWLFIARFGFLQMFPFEYRIARFGVFFCWYERLERAIKGKKVQMETRLNS